MITIRRYTPKDWKAVCAVILPTVEVTFRGEQPKAALRLYRTEFDLKTGTGKSTITKGTRVVFVACHRGKIVGVLRGNPGKRIGLLYVTAAYQGQGIGQALTQKYFRYSKSKGEYIVRVRATPSAVSFYQKIGFRRMGGIRRGKVFIYQPMRIVLS